MFIKYFNKLWWIVEWVSVTINSKIQADQIGYVISSVGSKQVLYIVETRSMILIQGYIKKINHW